MKPRPSGNNQRQLFQANFRQILNPNHSLCKVANKINWDAFDTALADCYAEDIGAPAKATRLMVGLHYLKYAFDESDETVVEKWIENPYWQYLCGYDYMQHECPIHPTSMTKWRNRLGSDKLETLLAETIQMALREKFVRKSELTQVTVDTTVQEKNITHPTDAKLLGKAIEALGKAAKEHHIPVRQSYRRVAKRAQIKAGRYAHARQFKRMRREIRFLQTRLGRMIRDIERKQSIMPDSLTALLTRCKRVHEQKRTDKNKLYSLHEPDVQCIAKGKAHKRYEFGCKVAVATSNRGDWFLASVALAGNPYDGHTLAESIAAIERITNINVKHAYVDKGYRGHNYKGDGAVHISGLSSRGLSWSQRRRQKRRSAIEPKIGHAKRENRLGRCFLKGNQGDKFNAVLSAAGANFKKLLRRLSFLCHILWGVSREYLRRLVLRYSDRFERCSAASVLSVA